MKLTLIPILLATNLIAQDLPIKYGEKYFSNFNVIYTEIEREIGLIEFFEFDKDGHCGLFDMNGQLIEEAKYKIEYLSEKDSLSWEDEFNVGWHKLTLRDTIVWGYLKKSNNEKITILSRLMGDARDAGFWLPIKETKIWCSKFCLRRLIKKSKWTATVDGKEQEIEVIGDKRKKEKNELAAEIVKIDDGLLMTWTPKGKEHSKWRILEISKKKLVIEFAFGHPNGIIEYKRKKGK